MALRDPALTAAALREAAVREVAAEAPGEAVGVTTGPATSALEVEAEIAAEPEGSGEVKPFSSLVPAIIGSAMLMQTLNATVLSNALPTMAHALGEDPIHLNTAITVYLLASAVFLPISGWAADKFGAKRVFLTSIVLFTAACTACGFAQNLTQLLTARLFQGAAGAMMMPVGRLVLLRSTPKHDLVRAMSVLTMPSLLGPVIGPPIGGAIVTYGSWRWIFFLNLPIAALGLFLVWRFIRDIEPEGAPKLDFRGLILTGLGMAGVVWGFENLGRGALPPAAIAGMLGGGATLLALYAVHARRTPHAILDLKLLKVRTFSASVIGGAFMRMGMGANPFMLALLFQVAFGMSAFQAGMMTFASAAAALIMKTAAPPILARFGFKRVLTVNAVIVALTFMAYALFKPTTPQWVMYAVLLAGGFFRSLQFTSLNGLAFADIDQPVMSRASTMSTMGQQLAQSFGIGLAAMLLHLFAHRGGGAHLTAAGIAPAFLAVGAVAMVSTLFFVGLPNDAGAELHGLRRPKSLANS